MLPSVLLVVGGVAAALADAAVVACRFAGLETPTPRVEALRNVGVVERGSVRLRESPCEFDTPVRGKLANLPSGRKGIHQHR